MNMDPLAPVSSTMSVFLRADLVLAVSTGDALDCMWTFTR